MKNTDPINVDEADKKEDTCNLHEDQLDDCEDGMLTYLDEPMTLANESFSQAQYQKLIAHYYFGEYQTHPKFLYPMFKLLDTIRCNNCHSGETKCRSGHEVKYTHRV